jgi:hypothetical protein
MTSRGKKPFVGLLALFGQQVFDHAASDWCTLQTCTSWLWLSRVSIPDISTSVTKITQQVSSPAQNTMPTSDCIRQQCAMSQTYENGVQLRINTYNLRLQLGVLKLHARHSWLCPIAQLEVLPVIIVWRQIFRVAKMNVSPTQLQQLPLGKKS